METSEDIHGRTTEFFPLSTDGYEFKIVAQSYCPSLSVLEAKAARHNLARFHHDKLKLDVSLYRRMTHTRSPRACGMRRAEPEVVSWDYWD